MAPRQSGSISLGRGSNPTLTLVFWICFAVCAALMLVTAV
jgi:hypothetical protein